MTGLSAEAYFAKKDKAAASTSFSGAKAVSLSVGLYLICDVNIATPHCLSATHYSEEEFSRNNIIDNILIEETKEVKKKIKKCINDSKLTPRRCCCSCCGCSVCVNMVKSFPDDEDVRNTMNVDGYSEIILNDTAAVLQQNEASTHPEVPVDAWNGGIEVDNNDVDDFSNHNAYCLPCLDRGKIYEGTQRSYLFQTTGNVPGSEFFYHRMQVELMNEDFIAIATPSVTTPAGKIVCDDWDENGGIIFIPGDYHSTLIVRNVATTDGRMENIGICDCRFSRDAPHHGFRILLETILYECINKLYISWDEFENSIDLRLNACDAGHPKLVGSSDGKKAANG